MNIGDIVQKDGKKYVIESIITYDFGKYPNLRCVGNCETPVIKEETQAIEEKPLPFVTVPEKDYEDMSLQELRDLCKERNLTIRGSKADVIERLKA